MRSFMKGVGRSIVYEEYLVTWNQVKNLVDKMFEDHEEKVCMGDIERAVKQAWLILYDDMARKYREAENERRDG